MLSTRCWNGRKWWFKQQMMPFKQSKGMTTDYMYFIVRAFIVLNGVCQSFSLEGGSRIDDNSSINAEFFVKWFYSNVKYADSKERISMNNNYSGIHFSLWRTTENNRTLKRKINSSLFPLPIVCRLSSMTSIIIHWNWNLNRFLSKTLKYR